MTKDEIVDAIMSPGGARSSWKLHYQLDQDERDRIDCAAKAEAKKLRLHVCSRSLPPRGSLLRKFVTTQQEEAEANMQEMVREHRKQLDDAIVERALLQRFSVDPGLEDDKY
jgi:hypothetical protein